jgi:hypothetical protein
MPEELFDEQAASLVRKDSPLDQALHHIRAALAGLQFGEVSVIVQDGVVIQVERTERKRLRRGER